MKGEVDVGEPQVTVCGVTVKHNTVRWHVAKNRHPTTYGRPWGWIEGAPGNVCWSDEEAFNYNAAERMTAEHNQWLEDQKPLSIKLIEARERKEKALHRYDSAKAEFDIARSALAKCDAEIAALSRLTGAA